MQCYTFTGMLYRHVVDMDMGMIHMCTDSKTVSSTLLLCATLYVQLLGAIPHTRHTAFPAAPS